MIELSYTQVCNLASEAVSDKPVGYIYCNQNGEQATPIDSSFCTYVHEGEDGEDSPGCIVGHIMHAAGVPLDVLKRNEVGAQSLLRDLERSEILVTDRASWLFLAATQRAQDLGTPWSAAVQIGTAAVGAQHYVDMRNVS
jgi:hypothetical protein